MFHRKLKKRLEAGFGKVPDPMYFHGDMEYIRAYFDFRKENKMDAFLIDDITANDLDLDKVFKRINPGLSTSGEQYLYYQLRSPAVESGTYHERKKLIDFMTAQPDLRLKLQVILSRLGRTRRADLSRAFYPSEHGSLWLIIYLFLAFLVPAAILFAALSNTYGMLTCIGILSFNVLIHDYRKKKCQTDLDTVNYSVSMIFALHKIRKMKNAEIDQSFQTAYANLDRLHSVLRTGGVSAVSDGGVGDLVSTVLLLDLIAYEFLKNKLGRCHTEVFAVHEALGKIDAAIAIASYRKSLGTYADRTLTFPLRSRSALLPA